MLSDRFGRKRMLFLCGMLYGLSAVLFLPALTPNLNPFLVARFICGLGIGASSMICPVYIAELAPEKWRGRLGTLFQLGIVVGIFLTLFINKTIQGCGDDAWNTAYRLAVDAGHRGRAGRALHFLCCWASPRARAGWPRTTAKKRPGKSFPGRLASVDGEQQMTEIREAIGQEEGRFSELFEGVYFRPLVLAVVLMFCSQFCGINAIIYYSTKIFEAAGADKTAAFTATAWVGLVNVLATLVGDCLVDKAGRRPLLLLGTAVQTLALGMIGWMFFAKLPVGGSRRSGQVFQFIGSMVDPQQAALFGCIIVFTAAFGLAMGPIGWLFCSEVFPNRVRGRAMSVAAMTRLDLLLHRRSDLSHAERQPPHRAGQDLLDLRSRELVLLRLRVAIHPGNEGADARTNRALLERRSGKPRVPSSHACPHHR